MSLQDKTVPTAPQLSTNVIKELPSAIRYFATSIMSALPVCIPVVVLSYDKVFGRVTVVPAIKVKKETRQETKRVIGEIEYEPGASFKVNVRQFCCGGVAIDFPIYSGDKGWVIAADDDMALAWAGRMPASGVLDEDKSYDEITERIIQIPGTTDKHIPEHGFFIPDCWEVFYPPSIKISEGECVPEDALFIGGSVPKTIEYKENDGGGYSHIPAEEKIDGVASIVITRGTEDGKVLISVGSKVGVSVSKTGIKLVAKQEEGDSSDEGDKESSITMSAVDGSVSLEALEDLSIKAKNITVDAQQDITINAQRINLSAENINVSSSWCNLPQNTTVGERAIQLV